MEWERATELFRRGIITIVELRKAAYNYIFDSNINNDIGLMRACEVDAWFDTHPQFK